MRPKGGPKGAGLLYALLDSHWFWLYTCGQNGPSSLKAELQVLVIVSTAKWQIDGRPEIVSPHGAYNGCKLGSSLLAPVTALNA